MSGSKTPCAPSFASTTAEVAGVRSAAAATDDVAVPHLVLREGQSDSVSSEVHLSARSVDSLEGLVGGEDQLLRETDEPEGVDGESSLFENESSAWDVVVDTIVDEEERDHSLRCGSSGRPSTLVFQSKHADTCHARLLCGPG